MGVCLKLFVLVLGLFFVKISLVSFPPSPSTTNAEEERATATTTSADGTTSGAPIEVTSPSSSTLENASRKRRSSTPSCSSSSLTDSSARSAAASTTTFASTSSTSSTSSPSPSSSFSSSSSSSSSTSSISSSSSATPFPTASPPPPNILLFIADDMGYGDLSVYGHPSQERGPIDALARSGMTFTSMYASAPSCTPSRGSLMTGRQPFRLGLQGDHPVLLPHFFTGLAREEVTIAEVLRAQGYRTGMVGKWHLGINRATSTDGYFLPQHQGFDYVGTNLPLSFLWCPVKNYPPPHWVFAYHGDKMLQQPLQYPQVSSALLHDARSFLYDTEETLGRQDGNGDGKSTRSFLRDTPEVMEKQDGDRPEVIEKQDGDRLEDFERQDGYSENNKRRPFFLFYSFPQPHTPMLHTEGFAGKSRNGAYGDQIMEIQWAVGEILETLDRIGERNNTLVIFTSDHGPHKEIGLEGGSAGYFKGGKMTYYEGGLRVPFIASWPGVIPANSINHNVLSLMDLLPTMHSLTHSRPQGGQMEGRMDGQMEGQMEGLMEGLMLDGKSFAHQLFQSDPEPESRFLPILCANTLMSVRYGPYKLHFRTFPLAGEEEIASRLHNGITSPVWYKALACEKVIELETPLLYNVESDPGERYPLSLQDYPEIYAEILRELESFMETVPEEVERLHDVENMRKSLAPCCNPPYCMCFDTLWSRSICPVESL